MVIVHTVKSESIPHLYLVLTTIDESLLVVLYLLGGVVVGLKVSEDVRKYPLWGFLFSFLKKKEICMENSSNNIHSHIHTVPLYEEGGMNTLTHSHCRIV